MGWFDFLKPQKAKQRAGDARDCFNIYQNWFTSLDATEESVDLTLTVRIRAFGNEDQKQAAWQEDWRTKNPFWGKVSAGTNVSSTIPELWMDLRMCKAGMILPLHVLAHELAHSIHNADKRVVNPDLLINEEIY